MLLMEGTSSINLNCQVALPNDRIQLDSWGIDAYRLNWTNLYHILNHTVKGDADL